MLCEIKIGVGGKVFTHMKHNSNSNRDTIGADDEIIPHAYIRNACMRCSKRIQSACVICFQQITATTTSPASFSLSLSLFSFSFYLSLAANRTHRIEQFMWANAANFTIAIGNEENLYHFFPFRLYMSLHFTVCTCIFYRYKSMLDCGLCMHGMCMWMEEEEGARMSMYDTAKDKERTLASSYYQMNHVVTE